MYRLAGQCAGSDIARWAKKCVYRRGNLCSIPIGQRGTREGVLQHRHLPRHHSAALLHYFIGYPDLVLLNSTAESWR